MDNEVYQLLLNGMPIKEFLVYYIFGIAGALSFFLYSVWNAINEDSNTPSKFSWKFLLKGTIRVVLSLITLAFVVIYFKQISPFMFDVTNTDVDVKINGFSAFLAGVSIDTIWKALLGVGKKGTTTIVKKVTKK